MTRTTCFWGREGIKMWPWKKKMLPTKTPLMLYVFQNYSVTRLLVWSTETPLVMNVQLRLLDLSKTPCRSESVTTLPNANRGRQTLGSVTLLSMFIGHGETGTQMGSKGPSKTDGQLSQRCLWAVAHTPYAETCQSHKSSENILSRIFNSLPLTHGHP